MILKKIEIIPFRLKLEGKITIPSSKSHTLRALLFSSMAKGVSQVKDILLSPDSVAMIEACRSLGAEISCDGNIATIKGIAGKITPGIKRVNSGNSGLVLRFMSAIAALGNDSVFITGDQSICQNRPMSDLLMGLENLGVKTKSNNGYAPLEIKGPMRGYKTSVLGNDSQPVSALLIAAALSDKRYEILVEDPGEKPWIDLTLNWLDRLGVTYTNETYSRYVVHGKGVIDPIHYRVPGDLSSCAFPVAAALVTGSSLVIENVDLSDLQGDKKVFSIMRQMGADIEEKKENRTLVVKGEGASLKGIDVDINDCIDAIVILSVVACYAKGKTVIRNAAVARDKECDRITSVREELTKMGAKIEERPDGLVIHGSELHAATVSSHGDHRIAMGLAVAALPLKKVTTVLNTSCIEKTYPSFVSDFNKIGALMREGQ